MTPALLHRRRNASMFLEQAHEESALSACIRCLGDILLVSTGAVLQRIGLVMHLAEENFFPEAGFEWNCSKLLGCPKFGSFFNPSQQTASSFRP